MLLPWDRTLVSGWPWSRCRSNRSRDPWLRARGQVLRWLELLRSRTRLQLCRFRTSARSPFWLRGHLPLSICGSDPRTLQRAFVGLGGASQCPHLTIWLYHFWTWLSTIIFKKNEEPLVIGSSWLASGLSPRLSAAYQSSTTASGVWVISLTRCLYYSKGRRGCQPFFENFFDFFAR